MSTIIRFFRQCLTYLWQVGHSVGLGRNMDNDRPHPETFTIAPARNRDDYEAVSKLFTDYANSLGIDLTFQSFAEELSGLPGKYAPPTGELLLARGTDDDGRPLGCVAVRPLNTLKDTGGAGADISARPTSSRCEFKRFYVDPGARGMGVGEGLARAIIGRAGAELGYDEAVIDTLPSMASALRIYERLGFVEIAAYYDTPIAGTRFFRLDLGGRGETRTSPMCSSNL